MRTLVIQNQEFAENVRRVLFMICCPLKLRQWHSGCSPEHRMCPMDFVPLLGRLEILSTSVSGGHPECRSRSVARAQKLSPAEIFANSMILSKTVLRIDASHRFRGPQKSSAARVARPPANGIIQGGVRNTCQNFYRDSKSYRQKISSTAIRGTSYFAA